jgi:hypothetical protein
VDTNGDTRNTTTSAVPLSGSFAAAFPLGVPDVEAPVWGLKPGRELILEARELGAELEQPVREPALLRADVVVARADRQRGTALLAGHVRRLGDRSEHRRRLIVIDGYRLRDPQNEEGPRERPLGNGSKVDY